MKLLKFICLAMEYGRMIKKKKKTHIIKPEQDEYNLYK